MAYKNVYLADAHRIADRFSFGNVELQCFIKFFAFPSGDVYEGDRYNQNPQVFCYACSPASLPDHPSQAATAASAISQA